MNWITSLLLKLSLGALLLGPAGLPRQAIARQVAPADGSADQCSALEAAASKDSNRTQLSSDSTDYSPSAVRIYLYAHGGSRLGRSGCVPQYRSWPSAGTSQRNNQENIEKLSSHQIRHQATHDPGSRTGQSMRFVTP